ncbi:hypothetical protein BG000_005158 [Podila horticola]|nr:hypothetical protein BG000_005158 [Podila horticola]
MPTQLGPITATVQSIFAAVLKPAKPEPYTGLIDADACLNFVDNQAEYFEIVELNKAHWVKYTALALKGDAKTWWHNSSLTISTPWAEFCKDFVKAHTPQMLRSRPCRTWTTSSKEYLWSWNTPYETKLRQPKTMIQAIYQATVVWGVVFQHGPPTAAQESAMDMDMLLTSTTSTMATPHSIQGPSISPLVSTPPWLRVQSDPT